MPVEPNTGIIAPMPRGTTPVPLASLGAPCSADGDCGEDAICSARWSPSLSPQCTAHCLEDENVCEEVFGEGACAVECYRPCDSDADCPDGTGCGFGECRPRCSSDEDCWRTCDEGFCKP